MPCHFRHQRDIPAEKPPSDWWVQAQDPTLLCLIKTALTYNYDMRIAFESVEAARARYRLSAAQLLPLLTVIGRATRTQLSKALIEDSFLTKYTFNFLQFGFDVLWELDIWGRLLNQKRSQKALLQAEIEQVYGVYITLIADVARVYIDWCTFHQHIVYAQKQLLLEKQKTHLITDRVNAGLSSIIDLEVQLQQEYIAGSQLKDFIKKKELAYNALLLLLGMQQDSLLQITPGKIPFSDYHITVGIPSQLLQRRPDIRAAERVLAAQNASIGAVCAQWFPQFMLLGGVTTEANKTTQLFSGESLAWNIGPSVSWPLINFGRIRARIQEAEAEKRKAALLYSKTVIAALKDVEDALVLYFTAFEQKRIAQMQYNSLYNEFLLKQSLTQAGLIQRLDLLAVEYNVYTQMHDLIAKDQLVASAVVSVYKALGGGW